MIKRIELTNFMSHEHSVFELSEGLNVLVGPNNCGKSAVVTALQILCYNDSSTYVLRHESRDCSILVETTDGDSVLWSRKKNGSPWYEINGERFDRLGKNNVPDRLHEVLRLPRVCSEKDRFDVHFGEQRSPVFLLNEKPRQAADFFASSSDARHLLEMQARHKNNVRESNIERKNLEREAAELDKHLSRLTPLPSLEESLINLEADWEALQELQEQIFHVHNLIGGIQQKQAQIAHLNSKSRCLQELPEPPKLNELAPLARLIQSLDATARRCSEYGLKLKLLTRVSEPPVLQQSSRLQELIWRQRERQEDVTNLNQKTELLATLPEPPSLTETGSLVTTTNRLSKQLSQVQGLEDSLERKRKERESLMTQITRWVEQNPQCPTCGGPVTIEGLVKSEGSR